MGDTFNGAVLREQRKAAGLTQDDVAHALGVSAAAVSAWERGTSTPSRRHQRRLPAVLAGDLAGTLSHPTSTLDPEELLARIRAELAEHERRIAEMVAGLMKGEDNEQPGRERRSVESDDGASAARTAQNSE